MSTHTIPLPVPPELAEVTLRLGAHPSRKGGFLSFMEAVALYAGEPHGMYPKTADYVIAVMAVGINDIVDDTVRQQLKPLVPHVKGTADDGLADARLAFAMRFFVSELAPELLGQIGEYGWEDTLSAYYENLPDDLADLGWTKPLADLQHARMYVKTRSHEAGGLSFNKRQAYQDVDAMLGRMIAGLTDLVDPERTPGDHVAIAASLSHVFHVFLDFDWTHLQNIAAQFLGRLIFVGRESYL